MTQSEGMWAGMRVWGTQGEDRRQEMSRLLGWRGGEWRGGEGVGFEKLGGQTLQETTAFPVNISSTFAKTR